MVVAVALIILLVIAVINVLALVSPETINPVLITPEYITCNKFVTLVGNLESLNVLDCMSYLKDNPHATGQEIVNHYVDEPLNRLLPNPLLQQ